MQLWVPRARPDSWRDSGRLRNGDWKRHAGGARLEARLGGARGMKIAIVAPEDPQRRKVFQDLATPDMELAFVADKASDDEKLAVCKDADAVVLAAPGADLSTDVLRQCSKVKLVQGILAGYDRIDVKGMAELGIPYANNGGGNALAVAEHALGLMLALGRGIVR